MTTSEQLSAYKRTLIQKLVQNQELIDAMGNPDIVEADDAIYKYIFPYLHIPYTIEAAHSYICMRGSMQNRGNRDTLFVDFILTVWIIVHQDIMEASGTGGATRADYLAGLVEKELDGSEAFGTHILRVTSNEEENMDIRHRCRILTFATKDIGTQMECG